MRGQVLGLLVTAALSAGLDMPAVLSMLPLTRMLTSEGELPGSVQRYLVPLLGTEDRPRVLLALAGLVAGAFILTDLALTAIRWWSLGVTSRAEAAAQSELLRRDLGAPYAAHRRRPLATILQVLSGAVPTAFSRIMLG